MTRIAAVPRLTTTDRLAALEQRADNHDKLITPMASKIDELFAVYERVLTINWFLVKVAAWIGGGLGFVAVLLTIGANAAKLLGH